MEDFDFDDLLEDKLFIFMISTSG